MPRGQTPLFISSSSEDEAAALPSFIPASLHLTALRDAGLPGDSFPTQSSTDTAILAVVKPEYVGSSSPSVVVLSPSAIRAIDAVEATALICAGNTRADCVHHPYSDSRPPLRASTKLGSPLVTEAGVSTQEALSLVDELQAQPVCTPTIVLSSPESPEGSDVFSTDAGLSYMGKALGDHPAVPIDLVSSSEEGTALPPPAHAGSAWHGGRMTAVRRPPPLSGLEAPSRPDTPLTESNGSTPKQRGPHGALIAASGSGSPSVVTWSDPSQLAARRLLEATQHPESEIHGLLSEESQIEVDNAIVDLRDTLNLLASRFSHYYINGPLDLCDGNNTSLDNLVITDTVCILVAALDIGMVEPSDGNKYRCLMPGTWHRIARAVLAAINCGLMQMQDAHRLGDFPLCPCLDTFLIPPTLVEPPSR
jgi:hypothetical protein